MTQHMSDISIHGLKKLFQHGDASPAQQVGSYVAELNAAGYC